MKRRDFLATCGAVLSAGTAACGGIPDGRSIVDTPEKHAAYMRDMLKRLCTDLGPHPCGSPEYDIAADIVRREMERSLPHVFYDTLAFDRWMLIGDAVFTIDGIRMDSFIAHGAGGTSREGIRGVLRQCSLQNTPYAVHDTTNGDMLARVAISEAWAVAGLAVARPWYRYYEEPGGMPVFNIGKPDVHILEDAVARQLPVEMKANVRFIPDMETSNIVGTLPGDSKEEIVLYAHLDTVYNSEGANDNTGSVIMLLMLAHALSGRRHPKTITFMATTGEEYNYLGTKQYAKTRVADGTLGDISFIVNFDSVTWGPNMRLITLDEDVVNELADIDRRLGLDGEPVWSKGDGLLRETTPLKEAGIRARGLVVDSGGYNINHVWHRPTDTADTVPIECAEVCFRLFEEFVPWLMR